MRCFVAAWPSAATRRELAALIETLRPALPEARAMQPRNLHLTLAFIGELDAIRAADAARACAAASGFSWSIAATGAFARARVAWAGGASNPAVEAAARAARAALDALGVAYDRKPFVPHVTLFRDVHRYVGGTLSRAIDWGTEHIALYAAAHDEAGPVYRRVATG